jgi:RhoGEF, Guanine nucleotide exchange factor for Rho/Rac/Cdc42-like GTPases
LGTREIYTHFNLDAYFDSDPIYLMSVRLGISPYLVEYDGLSTWLILHVENKIVQSEHEWTIIPVIRLFQNNVLVEVGSDMSSKFLLTLMVHI